MDLPAAIEWGVRGSGLVFGNCFWCKDVLVKHAKVEF